MNYFDPAAFESNEANKLLVLIRLEIAVFYTADRRIRPFAGKIESNLSPCLTL